MKFEGNFAIKETVCVCDTSGIKQRGRLLSLRGSGRPRYYRHLAMVYEGINEEETETAATLVQWEGDECYT